MKHIFYVLIITWYRKERKVWSNEVLTFIFIPFLFNLHYNFTTFNKLILKLLRSQNWSNSTLASQPAEIAQFLLYYVRSSNSVTDHRNLDLQTVNHNTEGSQHTYGREHCNKSQFYRWEPEYSEHRRSGDPSNLHHLHHHRDLRELFGVPRYLSQQVDMDTKINIIFQ